MPPSESVHQLTPMHADPQPELLPPTGSNGTLAPPFVPNTMTQAAPPGAMPPGVMGASGGFAGGYGVDNVARWDAMPGANHTAPGNHTMPGAGHTGNHTMPNHTMPVADRGMPIVDRDDDPSRFPRLRDLGGQGEGAWMPGEVEGQWDAVQIGPDPGGVDHMRDGTAPLTQAALGSPQGSNYLAF
mmetsp:Transcript_15899/g.34525  ORF Transcript_15899/g.34525 Transcript_15899/m.34525 type:complete len:185 (+) Transcript_15899:346-900(+)